MGRKENGMSERKATVAALLAALGDLTPEEMLALADHPGEFKAFCTGLYAEEVRNTFVIPLLDWEVQIQFPQFADRLPPWRRLAVFKGYGGPVAWKIMPGFMVNKHAQLVGPCYSGVEYTRMWDNLPETPTKSCLVFWMPRLLKDSTVTNIALMEEWRAVIKQEYTFPPNHCDSFGSIQLLFALILAHFKRTGERVLSGYQYAVSDSYDECGSRIFACEYKEDGLRLSVKDGPFNHERYGFFPIGVEELDEPAKPAVAKLTAP
jgi:hypothetical protein